MNGALLDVSAGPVLLQAKDKVHCARPWVGGSRVVLVAYCAAPLPSAALTLTQYDPDLSSTCDPPACLLPHAFPDLNEYLDRVKNKTLGRHCLCRDFCWVWIRKAGLPGADRKPSTNSKCPMSVLDLVTPAGQEILWKILESQDLRACHLAPPCGRSSKARNIPAGPHTPRPLRNSEFPNGFPSMTGQDAARVHAANVLYGLTGSIILHCFRRGILVSVENPANSWFWLVSGTAKTNHLPLLSTYLHRCMFGASQKSTPSCCIPYPR